MIGHLSDRQRGTIGHVFDLLQGNYLPYLVATHQKINDVELNEEQLILANLAKDVHSDKSC